MKGLGKDCNGQKQTHFDGEGHMSNPGTSKVSYQFWSSPLGFIPDLGYTSLTLGQFISPPSPRRWPLKRSELPGGWQMCRYYIDIKFCKKNYHPLPEELYKQQHCY